MKKYQYINLIVGIIYLFSSCKEYLDVKPQGEVIPQTAEEFSALLHTHLDAIDQGSDSYIFGNSGWMLDLECFSDNLKKAGLTPADPARNFEPSTLQKALFPFRENFLTDKDRAWLENADDKALLSRAMRILYRPLAPNSWRAVDDPLGLFENWLSSQSSAERFTYIDGRTAVTDDSKRLWFVLQLKSKDVVAAVDGQKITMALAQAEAAARAKTDDKLKVLSAGIPLISEEVAHQAASEASFIGTISTLGIAALVLVFFARLIPLLQTLVVLTLAVAFAFSCVVAIFGEIHVVTIVFGATLLGVCVDYVFHLLCATSNGLTGMEASQSWRDYCRT